MQVARAKVHVKTGVAFAEGSHTIDLIISWEDVKTMDPSRESFFTDIELNGF